jgi:aromatic-L-amino-acid decarboxylase
MDHSKLDDLVEQASKKLHESVDGIESLHQWRAHMIEFIDEIFHEKVVLSTRTAKISNTSLDPSDWLSARHVAHRALDSTMDLIQSRRDQPVWQPVPPEVRSLLNDEPLPEQGEALSAVCHDIITYVAPYARGNTHPRFWGWAMGEGTLGGVLADMFTSTMNINAGGCSHSAVLIERRVIRWMRELFGFPRVDNGGIVVSGTSMATVIALATARRRFLHNVRTDGIVDGPRFIVYASTEAHMCVSKAMELLGMGSKAVHSIPTDQSFRMNIDELTATIEKDRKSDLVPFCIVGNAGRNSASHVTRPHGFLLQGQ